MKLKLPKIIGAYVKASNDSDMEKFISCFSDQATVLDEGETRKGHEAIRKWFTKTRTEYQFKSEPISIEGNNEFIIMTAKVIGTFPGSPINLKYQFKVTSGLIDDLRIVQ